MSWTWESELETGCAAYIADSYLWPLGLNIHLIVVHLEGVRDSANAGTLSIVTNGLVVGSKTAQMDYITVKRYIS